MNPGLAKHPTAPATRLLRLSPSAVLGGLLACAVSLGACEKPASPNGAAPSTAAETAVSTPSRDATSGPKSPKAGAATTAVAKLSPQDLQAAVVAFVSASEATLDGSWHTHGVAADTPVRCASTDITVTRRFENERVVVMEAVYRFDAPVERAAALIWVDVDSNGRATGIEVVGDGTLNARCAQGCSGVTQACPPPRLAPLPTPPAGPPEVIAAAPADTGADLKKAYDSVLRARSAQGGFEKYIDISADMEDAGSGRVRRGVSGFVDGLRRIEAAFPGDQAVKSVELVRLGDWVLARYTWLGSATKPRRVRVAEVARFKAGRLVWSRGYANPMAFLP